jgi:Uma2 family endonuclease
MATTAHGRRLTYEEFQGLPREEVGIRQMELIDGEVFVTPAPRTAHQRAVARLLRRLADFVEKNNMGEIFIAPYDVFFSKWTVLEPDLLFIRKERSAIVTDANVQGPPDLVIEVLSPSTRRHDRERKLRVYEEAGVPELWYVDPEERTVDILTLGATRRYDVVTKLAGTDTVVSSVLSGLHLTADDIFRT